MRVYRHVYQRSIGGQTYCPLEHGAKLLRNSTPRFARQVSSKYSNLSAQKVQSDLSENHGREVSQGFIRSLSQEVGGLLEQQEVNWTYALPPEALSAKVVSIGRDGTTSYIRSEGYRETMSGTISFYTESGKRVHTIYLAQAPEHGKATFDQRFGREIQRVKSLLKGATYLGVADGAKDNWSFLDPLTEASIIDFWHASEYLALASKAASRSVVQRKQWLKEARHRLRHEEGAAKKLLEEIKPFQRKHKLTKAAKEGLQRAITYFTNHHHQMNYPEYAKQNYPIGSGVTEAACKVLVKQRLCQSGMRWDLSGAQYLLNIRAVTLSDGRWKQFWNYVDLCRFDLRKATSN